MLLQQVTWQQPGMLLQQGTGQQLGMLLQEEAGQEPKGRKPYICGKCALYLHIIRLKADHPAGRCPSTASPARMAELEVDAKLLTGTAASKSLDVKQWAKLVHQTVRDPSQQLEFDSEAAKQLVLK